MMFVQSLNGLSHNRAEDTKREHIELAVKAFGSLAGKAMAWIGAGGR
jgi:N-carbamoyl-L-amino-acid hydrolase